MLNALSIDVEDWFHAELVRSRVLQDRPERRVHWAIEPFLTLLARYDVRATFFIVGDVLCHHPDLVRRIRSAGHEIGCHGWSHRPLWTLDPERFAQELIAFDRDATGVVPLEEIIGFRAPSFSLEDRTRWALGILRRHGFRYDSSVFPLRTPLYGIDGAPTRPYYPNGTELCRVSDKAGFIEFPMTVCRWAGLDVPVSGGFYLRATPLPLLLHLLRRVNARGDPFVIYLHPWEADAHTSRVKGLSPVQRFVTYYNARSVLVKLEALLQRFRFAPLRDVLRMTEARRKTGDEPAC